MMAGLAARLGYDAVWWRHPPLLGETPVDLTELLRSLLQAATPLRVGVIVDVDRVPAGDSGVVGAAEFGTMVDLTGSTPAQAAWIDRLPCGFGSDLGLGVGPGPTADLLATAQVDRILVPVAPAKDLEQAVSSAVAAAGARSVAVELPVSIGRTTAEASARADHEPLFAITGCPRSGGLFGTLEQCQDSALALVHAGVAELRAHLPFTADVADVLAQLTAVAVGSVERLRPGMPRSPDPPPPVGWGGRRPPRLSTADRPRGAVSAPSAHVPIDRSSGLEQKWQVLAT